MKESLSVILAGRHVDVTTRRLAEELTTKDSGWRYLSYKDATAFIAIRRVGATVWLRYRNLTWAETRYDIGTYRTTIPDGFAPDGPPDNNSNIVLVATTSAFNAASPVMSDAGISYDGAYGGWLHFIGWRSGIDSVVFRHDMSWPTSDPWPTELPGTAA